MNTTPIFNQVKVDPNHLLDALLQKLNLKNDAALSRALEVSPPMISKIRHRKLPVGAFLLIRMHEVSDLTDVTQPAEPGVRNRLGGLL